MNQAKAAVRFAAVVEDQKEAFDRLYPGGAASVCDVENMEPAELIQSWLILTDAIAAKFKEGVPEAIAAPET